MPSINFVLSFLGIGIYDRDKSDVILLCNLEVHW